MPDDRPGLRIPTVALRFFNVYGTRQALSNPYTGVLAIFASRLLNDRPPSSSRTACSSATSSACTMSRGPAGWRWKCPTRPAGSSTSAAADPTPCWRSPSAWRRCWARSTSSRRSPASTASATSATASPTSAWPGGCSGYEPQVTLEEGLAELAAWLEGQVADDRVAQARAELDSAGWRFECRRARRSDCARVGELDAEPIEPKWQS